MKHWMTVQYPNYGCNVCGGAIVRGTDLEQAAWKLDRSTGAHDTDPTGIIVPVTVVWRWRATGEDGQAVLVRQTIEQYLESL